MDWIDRKYISLVSPRLEQFKQKSPNLYNFRCCYCGDSKKNKFKARGFIYEREGEAMICCHNCNMPQKKLGTFIKDLDINLHNEYRLEKLKQQHGITEETVKFEEKMKPPVFLKNGPLKGLKKVSQLSHNDPVKKFVDARKIPTTQHYKLFSCPNFYAYTNTLIPNKFKEEVLRHDETKLLIPLLDKNKNCFAYQGRALGPSKTKYITIVLDENVPRVWGLDSTNLDKETYVFEGPIDAMFIPNSISTCGGDLVSTLKPLPKENMVIVYDNEPRSPETKKKIEKAILQGYSVCIWPDNLEYKDVNEMILGGLSSDFIYSIIKQNIYRELNALLRLKQWHRV